MDTPTLAFCVLIQQRQRNKAIGITNDTQFLRGMAAFVRHKTMEQIRDATQLLTKAAYLKALIEEHQTLAARLSDFITENIEDDDIRNQGVYAMTKLDAYVSHLGSELEVIL